MGDHIVLGSNAFEFDVRVRKVRGFCSSSTVNKCSSSSSKFDFFQLSYIFLGRKMLSKMAKYNFKTDKK